MLASDRFDDGTAESVEVMADDIPVGFLIVASTFGWMLDRFGDASSPIAVFEQPRTTQRLEAIIVCPELSFPWILYADTRGGFDVAASRLTEPLPGRLIG